MGQAVANIRERSYLLGHGIQGGFDLQKRKAGLEHLCLLQEPMPGGAGDGDPDSSKVLRAIRLWSVHSGLQSHLRGCLGHRLTPGTLGNQATPQYC